MENTYDRQGRRTKKEKKKLDLRWVQTFRKM